MPDDNKKGITVKIDAELHAQVREYIEKYEAQAKNEEKKKSRRVNARRHVSGEVEENEEVPAQSQ